MTQPLARTEFAAALHQICSERGIEPEAVLETIKAAMVAAYRKDHGAEYNQAIEAEFEFEAEINPTTGEAQIFKVKGKKRENITPPGFGRIAAQTAKQVILQRVREAEKDAIIDEYSQRLKSIISGMVLRFDGPNVIVDIGRGQGVMPPEEQVRAEHYRLNQRLTVYLLEIRDTMKGKAVIVSRATPELVKELFRREVPEIASKAVAIKAIAREPGNRTKIAVHSTQEGVDPVGSCVGQKGVRVQAVINELAGEKIDIIQYSDKPKEFITAALAPAEGLSISLNEKKKQAQVTVPDDQLSLAIGRGGQNVRLAAKLTGYKIDIQGESGGKVSVTGEEEYEIDQLKLPTRVRNSLVKASLTNIYQLKKVVDKLTDIPGIGDKSAQDIKAQLAAFTPKQEAKEKEEVEKKEKKPTKDQEKKSKTT